MAVSFIGRSRELATLNGLADRVLREQRPAAALILAPPGQGKSRLLTEAATASDAFVDLRVVGYEPERDVPLAAAADLVRALRNTGEPGRLLEEFLSEGPGGGGALEAVRVFEAAHRALGTFHAIRITVDDLQWADPLSVAMIHYLVRAAEGTSQPLFLLAASRPSPVAAAIATSFGEVLRARDGFERLELGPLEPDEARELARSMAPHVDHARIEAIVAGASGSPFWIGVLATGERSTDAADAIASRLDALGDDARALILALAVAARPLARTELARVMEWPLERVERALSESVDHALAAEVAGTVRLTHDLIREAAERRVGGEPRRHLHQALAGEFETGAGDDVTLLLAALVHRRAAGMACDEIALRVARSPKRRLVGEDGLGALVDIAREARPLGLELAAAVGDLAGEMGAFEVTLDVFSRLADDHPDPARRLQAMLGAGRAAHQLGRPVEARGYVGRIREMPLTEPALIAVDALEAAILIWQELRIPEGCALARDAVERARGLALRAGGSSGSNLSPGTPIWMPRASPSTGPCGRTRPASSRSPTR
jgi:AAA ATPase domain